MLIDNKHTIEQALANNRLEGLSVSDEVGLLIKMALSGVDVTTEQILELLNTN